jgi:hypothetical protein
VTQDYDTSRIENASVRKVVEKSYVLRPRYEAPILEDAREGTLGLLEVLQESAITTPKNKSSTRASFVSSLKIKTSGFLRTRSSGFKEESRSESVDESLMFEDHMTSPISSPLAISSSPLTPREASPMVGSFPNLKTKASVPSSIATSATATSTPYSRSQQYPPDTPDRPAPLNVSKTTPSLKVGTSRSVSTPSRTRFVTPLSPDGQSPPPLMPASSSPSQYTPSSRSKSNSKLKLSYIPPRYATKPANIDPFTSKDNDSATCVGSFTTSASKSPNEAAPPVELPQDTSSIKDSDADWPTAAEENSEPEETRRPLSFYDSRGFLIEDLVAQEEGSVSQDRVINPVAMLTCELG